MNKTKKENKKVKEVTKQVTLEITKEVTKEVTVEKLKVFLLSCFQKNDKRVQKKGNVKVGVKTEKGITTLFLDKSEITNGFKVNSITHKKLNIEKSLLTALEIQDLNYNKNVVVLNEVVGSGTNVYTTLILKNKIFKINWDSKEVSNKYNFNVLNDFYDMLEKFFDFEKSEIITDKVHSRKKGDTLLKLYKSFNGLIIKIQINNDLFENKEKLKIDDFLDYLENKGISETILNKIDELMN